MNRCFVAKLPNELSLSHPLVVSPVAAWTWLQFSLWQHVHQDLVGSHGLHQER